MDAIITQLAYHMARSASGEDNQSFRDADRSVIPSIGKKMSAQICAGAQNHTGPWRLSRLREA
jgi:hypothetical protein